MHPNPPAGLSTRPLALTDLDATFAVYAAAEVEDAGTLALEKEDIEGDWARPSFDLARDTVGVFEGERLLGAAEVTRNGARAEAAVAPPARERGIGSWLAAWTEWRASEMGSVLVGQSTPEGSAADQLLLGRGYRLAHTSWVLELPSGQSVPERPLPDGYTMTTGDDPARERAAHDVIETAFGEWVGRERETYEDWAATTVARPGREPWQLRVVETASGQVVGACFTILDSQGCGFVHQLAVDRAHRGRGLARAMLADGFAAARGHGATRSELSTDSRTGALGLYVGVGMVLTQTWTHLVTDLPRHR